MKKKMTVKEAAKDFFEGTVSKELLYREIRNGNIPHVKFSDGKIILDVETLERWWSDQLNQSVVAHTEEPSKEYGKLRRIAE